jgi:hypothetical protein
MVETLLWQVAHWLLREAMVNPNMVAASTCVTEDTNVLDSQPLLADASISGWRAHQHSARRHPGALPTLCSIASHARGQTCDGDAERSQCVSQMLRDMRRVPKTSFSASYRHHLNRFQATTTICNFYLSIHPSQQTCPILRRCCP